MTDYKGSGLDQTRIRQLEKKREQERQQFTAQLQKVKQDNESGLKDINQKFAARTLTAEDQLKHETIGLVTAEEFRKRKQELQLEGPSLKEAPKRKRETKLQKSRLSFDLDGEEGEEGEQNPQSGEAGDDADMLPPPAKRISKDPTVDTSFLPDRERDERERLERLRLKQEWLAEQERKKEEIIPVTFSYYDGTGHRRTLKVKAGTTIEQFLALVRKEFKELRGVSTDNLLFIKEDLILPHNYSFYELVETKARGKSGPLFYWDVHEDVRFTSDASVEKEESHAAKVVERRFYDANKHIFPMNRWEVFDPNKKYDSYTIKDTNKK